MVHWISHVEHDQLAADPPSDTLHELCNEVVDLMPGLLEEVERGVPNNAIQLFLTNHSFNQTDGFLEFGAIASDVLDEIYIVSLEIHPRH